MTKEEAEKRVLELERLAHDSIADAQKLCDEFGIDSLSMNIAYGMGGSYIPRQKHLTKEEIDDEFGYIADRCGVDLQEEGCWFASFQSC